MDSKTVLSDLQRSKLNGSHFYRNKTGHLFNLGEYSVQTLDAEYDEEQTLIVHFIDHDTYIKFTGQYDSYNDGTQWGQAECIVRPKTKTITDYETVKL